MTNQESLLRAILSTIARQTYSPAQLRAAVAPVGDGTKQVAAYNMCDGTKSQAEIGKTLKMDAGQLSRTISRWVELGLAFRLGEETEQKIVHLFRIPEDTPRKEKR